MFKNIIKIIHHQNFIDGVKEVDNYEFKVYSPNGNDYLYSFVVSYQDIGTIKEIINNIK